MQLDVPLILASASPRRVDLLRTVVPDFRVVAAEGVDEVHEPALTPGELTEHNARLKAMAVAARHPGALVLGADTLVYLEGEPLGKPPTLEAAAEMLRRLSGRTHEVCTGVCLAGPEPDRVECFHDLTQVTFRPLNDALIAEYLEAVPVLDKAGAYAAQERGELIIARLIGSLSNVVGLPMEALERHLALRFAATDPSP